MEWILEPFGYEFMLRALAAAFLVGLVCPLVGCFVVVRGLAFLGEALAHSVFPGVVIAYILGSSMLLGGLASGIVVALAIGVLSWRTKLDEQTSVGIVFPVAVSAGVLLLSGAPAFASDLAHILFGNLLGVTPADLTVSAAIAGLVLLAILVLYRPLAMVTFDPVAARLQGVPVAGLQLGLLVMLALVIVLAVQTAGNLLVLSLLVTPAATAWLISRSMPRMLIWSALFGEIAALGGVFVSFYYAVPVGPAAVLLAAAEFLIVASLIAVRGLRRLRVAGRLDVTYEP